MDFTLDQFMNGLLVFALVVVMFLAVWFYWDVYKATARRIRSERFDGWKLRWDAKLLKFPVSYLWAPFMKRRYAKLDFETEQEARQRKLEQTRQRMEEVGRMNERLQQERLEWAKKNPPKLYFNRVDGIIAVMTPAAYQRCKDETSLAIIDEKWPDNGTLMPSHEVNLFVNKSGLELFNKNFGTRAAMENRYLSGWASDYHGLLLKYGVVVEHKSDIFVPYVNESVAQFQDQRYQAHYSHNYELNLIFTQMPEHLMTIKE
jgi:hypothetical protein